MRVPVTCTLCTFSQRLDLRDLPEGKLVCPLCEHEAELPDESDLAEIERGEARRRFLTAVGGGFLALGLALTLGCALLSGAHPGESLFGVGLAGAAGVLGLLVLVVTVMQESKATGNYF